MHVARDLSTLDAPALSARLHALAGEERSVQAEFLRHLDELDRRRGFAELGYPSLWEYCLRALHLREGAAGRRIGAMKVLRRFPQLDGALRDGRLCLSTLCVLSPVLTDENVADLTTRAAFKTKAEAEELVVALKPRHAPADGVRRLAPAAVPPDATVPPRVPAAHPPVPAAPPRLPATPDSVACLAIEPFAAPSHAGVPTSESDAHSVPALPSAPPRRPELRAVADETWSLRVTLDAVAKRDLETLTQLLSHKIPSGDLAAVLKEALRCAIEKHGKRRGAVAPERPHTPTIRAANEPAPLAQGPRYANPGAVSAPVRDHAIPAAVRREVWSRDDGRCTFVAPDGTRCASRWKLELDHVDPRAFDGPPTTGNLRLRCRTHNLLYAEEVFGRGHMARFRRLTAAVAPLQPRPTTAAPQSSYLQR
jgi:hypothetical protein